MAHGHFCKQTFLLEHFFRGNFNRHPVQLHDTVWLESDFFVVNM
jgi:hypothetical protein